MNRELLRKHLATYKAFIGVDPDAYARDVEHIPNMILDTFTVSAETDPVTDPVAKDELIDLEGRQSEPRH